MASREGFRIEKAVPKEGESARFRVTFDLDGIPSGTEEPAPPSKSAPKSAPKVPPKSASSPAPSAETSLQQERKRVYEKAMKELRQAVEKAIEEGKESIARQEAEIRNLQEKRASVEKKLQGLGFFAFSAKKVTREELSRADQEIADARQKMNSLKQQARKKAEETLEQHSRLLPPVPSENSGGRAAPIGASEETMVKVRKIESVLSIVPKTAAEINADLGEDYTALQVANAAKFIPSACTTKVLRIVADKSGDLSLREFTAYYISV